MENGWHAVVAVSDDEDEMLISRVTRGSRNGGGKEKTIQRERTKMKLNKEEKPSKTNPKEEERGRGKRVKKMEDTKVELDRVVEATEVAEEEEDHAKPIGEVIRVTGRGRGRKNFYESFEYDGNRYELEDHVLLVPEADQKPYVAIIKDITQTKDGNMMVTGQWFYRPEEAVKITGGNWQSLDNRELFYSFHRDEIPAESVMHKCVVHYVPLSKQIPKRKEHPGFFVQKVYDTEQMRLFKLTEKYLDVTRDDEARSRSGQPPAETPGSCANNASEYFTILSNFKVLTGERQRDKWLEKLLQSIQYFCSPVDNAQNDGTENGGSDAADLTGDTDSAKHVNESLDNSADGDVFRWPNSVVPAVVSLEKAAHEALSSDFQKYNQKMRQLTFNLKNTSLLARRLLKGELDPSQILNMSPKELKEALTEEELASREPEEPELIQMTDARCKRCTEKKVQLVEIIQAGHRDRYSLECVACGNTWYAARDEVASLTIGPNLAESVGPEPLATAKFEDVEKNLTSPRRADEGASDILKKTTEAYMPVLDSQKSFNKTKPEDSATTSNAE
ncbi:hypothetical protein CQW23_00112 [Capsicum baccatum]|uniref:BAH domain-containing protein n=1 Tax=Capsicum baccatum TaxID=33114 RepID=A0A2G2XJW1_CAPBA|nr:hypothetical protein CQW23_00112 [Capsicum baccatum]